MGQVRVLQRPRWKQMGGTGIAEAGLRVTALAGPRVVEAMARDGSHRTESIHSLEANWVSELIARTGQVTVEALRGLLDAFKRHDLDRNRGILLGGCNL